MAGRSTIGTSRTSRTFNSSSTVRSNSGKNNNSNMITMAVVIAFLILAIFVMFYFNQTIMERFTGKRNYCLEYYYMDGCGHCDRFNESGVWDQLKKQYGDKVTFNKYNNREEKDRIDKYNISGFPTIILTKDDKIIKEYDGNRSKEDLEKFIVSYTEKVNA
jgi:thiol-disulfide isomerase/thioredoxin